MKIFKYLIISLFLNACGTDDSHKYSCVTAGESCGVKGEKGDPGTVGPAGSNGKNGTNGKDGVAGSNGTNGTIGAAGKDGTNGIDGQDGAQGPAGQNGQDAILSSGPVGEWVEGKTYSACHHDYLYLSNGWLLFRHQANGTNDQGAGTTGFDTWNVDIADFLLVSEVGNHTYCTLHFDKNALTLTGVVNDHSDGLDGTEININL